MLFNSGAFLFVFLPLTLIVFHLAKEKGVVREFQVWVLLLASAFFYTWWNPPYLALLIISISINYALGLLIAARFFPSLFLIVGLASNLGLIGYFKYAGFLIQNANIALGEMVFVVPDILLPLGISFFTFQQIAYLVDIKRGSPGETSFPRYALFVSFFPQLIAGPIVHYRTFGPQISTLGRSGLTYENVTVGLSIFIIGLFKKVVIADNLSSFANPLFSATGRPEFFEAWGGVLAYTFQIYFDFSGYSDMAIGLGRLFGIVLPVNFASPYKAGNIIEFWRRWHITLSRFLTEYLYIPLGGNRLGRLRQFVNVMVTMLLGGLWHGANWTFVVWGGFHAFLLILNHLYRLICPNWRTPSRYWRGVGWALTFLSIVVTWVFFRADNLGRSFEILAAMSGANGISVPTQIFDRLTIFNNAISALDVKLGMQSSWNLMLNYMWVGGAMAIALLAPNTCQLFSKYGDNSEGWMFARQQSGMFTWSASWRWIIVIAALGSLALLSLSSPTAFLYYNF